MWYPNRQVCEKEVAAQRVPIRTYLNICFYLSLFGVAEENMSMACLWHSLIHSAGMRRISTICVDECQCVWQQNIAYFLSSNFLSLSVFWQDTENLCICVWRWFSDVNWQWRQMMSHASRNIRRVSLVFQSATATAHTDTRVHDRTYYSEFGGITRHGADVVATKACGNANWDICSTKGNGRKEWACVPFEYLGRRRLRCTRSAASELYQKLLHGCVGANERLFCHTIHYMPNHHHHHYHHLRW